MKFYKYFFSAIMLFMCGTSYATDDVVSFSIGDKDGKELTVEPGGTVDAYIYLSCSDDAVLTRLCSGTAWLVLPEGFELVGTPEAVADNWNYSSNLEISTDDDGWWYMVAKSSATAETMPKVKSEGAIYKFTIKATSAEASDEPYVASFDALWIDDNVEGTSVETRYVIDDMADEHLTFNITVGAAAETVSITLDHDVITYCSEKALDFTGVEGLTASYISEVSGTVATATGVGKAAAGMGIILEGVEGTTYEVPVVEEAAVFDDNLLIGVTKATEIEAGNYILMDGVFIPCIAGTLPAGKAYLPKGAVSSEAKVITLVFGESTGINEVQKAETEGAIYNLSGMRVSKTQKGVYIMNGRKVIVK